MAEIIRVEDQYYILATSSLADDRNHVLKDGETFAVFDRYGDIQPVGMGEQGIYHEGTRFLSRLTFTFGREGKVRPLLLSSTVNEDNILLPVDLTNPDISVNGEVVIPRGILHIFRSKFLYEGVCYERLRIWNYGLSPVDCSFSIQFEADFADIFEVRGIKRREKGRLTQEMAGSNSVLLVYNGLDGIIRRTRIESSPVPDAISPSEIYFEASIHPKERKTFCITISCESSHAVSSSHTIMSYSNAFAIAGDALNTAMSKDCDIYTSNEQFNDWVNRSITDLHLMITNTPDGLYPYAGVPWFSAVFGRDGIITAMESLWVNPDIARGVLSYLASTQAGEVIPEQDAEPGKIIHELRRGEMAALKEIPFGRYYGSVDSTPLFIMLAGAYFERTGDKPFIESIWQNIELALKWIDTYGDMDGDGFIEYFRHSSNGLVNQGWKDSHDSVFHADGSLVEGGIALCEVQGYVYAAKKQAGYLAEVLGYMKRAEELEKEAEDLKERFEDAFWCDDLGTYTIALDSRKRPCRVKSSNPGHCLFTGIASQRYAAVIAETLLSEDMFSGWGIRTIGSSDSRYNPMSYHNGSVWPHDNAIIAYGLARYGFKDAVLKVLTGLFDASLFVNIHRLPELFCGFPRRPGEGPTLYPVACAPQSWASASVFLILQSCLGLLIKADQSKIYFHYPLLPEFLQMVRIKRLRVGDASVDIELHRHEQDVSINIMGREGDIEVVVVK